MNKTSSMCMPFTCLYAALRCPRANSNALDRVKLAKISSLCAHAALEHHRRSSVAYLSFDNALAVSDLIRRIECVSQKTLTWYIQKQKHICIFVRMQNCNYINSGDGRATAEYRLKTMKTMMWLMISSADFSIASVQQCSTVIFY